jgi:hypothetical protein
MLIKKYQSIKNIKIINKFLKIYINNLTNRNKLLKIN